MDPTLTTGIPWLDRTLAILAAVGAICSLLSHVVSPDTAIGKAISWAALNFGKRLSKTQNGTVTELPPPPRGFVDRRALFAVVLLGLLGIACASMFGKTATRDVIDCGKQGLSQAAQDVLPKVAGALQQGQWKDLLAAIEQDAGEAAVCAVAVLVRDFEQAHAPRTASLTTDQAPVDASAYIHAKEYLADKPPVTLP